MTTNIIIPPLMLKMTLHNETFELKSNMAVSIRMTVKIIE